MPIGNLNLEFPAHNAERAYPLSIDATRVDTSGSFQLPDSFIVGLRLGISIALNVNLSKFYVRRVTNFETGYSVTIGYSADSGPIDVANVNIAKSTHTPNSVYLMQGVGDFDDTEAWMMIGFLDQIDEQPSGSFEFSISGGRLDLDTIYPNTRCVSSITVVNGSSQSVKLYKDIELAAGTNSRIRTVLSEEADPTIYIDFIDGEGSTEPCLCQDYEESPPIRRINQVGATPSGDFTFAAGNCVDIRAIQNGLKWTDSCSIPCCDCTALEKIVEDQKSFGDRLRSLESFLQRLGANVEQMNSVVIGSRLGDAGCSS